MPDSILDEDCFDLARSVLDQARAIGATLGTAESCTGGLIASALTAIPGSSDSFVGGIVSYWIDVKERILTVPMAIIEKHGVVSEECALSMANGAREALRCDFTVSTTGIAGPAGAEPGKPVGTVCFGIASSSESRTFTTCEGSSRDEVRLLACKNALRALLAEMQACSR